MKIGELIEKTDKPFVSLEFFPPAEETAMPAFFDTVDELAKYHPLFVSVTYGAGGGKQHKTLAVTAGLAQRGFTAMAHLTCVGATPKSINSFLEQLLANGVDNVLALRGDPPAHGKWDWNSGYFQYASDLVRFIKNEHPEMGIGVAAYPSPHPESSTYALDRNYTAQKLASGADFAITQLFFDVREYIDLVDNLHASNISIPVIPGILPIQSFDSLKRVLSLCGANIPAKFYLELERAHTEGGSTAVREAGFTFAKRQIEQLLAYGAPGIHLYTLNKSELCARIIQECGLA